MTDKTLFWFGAGVLSAGIGNVVLLLVGMRTIGLASIFAGIVIMIASKVIHKNR